MKNALTPFACAKPLATACRLLKQWTEATGDEVLKNLTPVRDARSGGKKPADFQRGGFPGAGHEAAVIDRLGPIKINL